MKLKTNFFTLLLLLFAVGALTAQSADTEETPSVISKGSLMVGGGLSFSSQGGDLFSSSRSNNLIVSPSALYFVADRIAIGGQLSYVLTENDGQYSHAIGIGPRVGYFHDLGNGLIPFGAIGGSYNNFWRPDTEFTNSGWGFTAGAGAIYNIGNWGISAELNYSWDQRDFSSGFIEGSASGDRVGFGLGLVGFINRSNSKDSSAEQEESPSLVRKGNTLVSGTLLFQNQGGELFSVRDNRSSSLSIQPSALYFVSDRIGVGGLVNYNISWDDIDAFHQLLAGPRVGYFYDLGNGFIPFGVAGVGFSRAWTRESDGGSNAMGVRAEVGTLIMVGKFGVSAGLNYDWASTIGNEGGNATGDVIGFNVGLVGFLTR